MPSLTRKMDKTGTGLRAVAVIAAAASLLPAGCAKDDTTAPSAARAQASTRARFGTVDCLSGPAVVRGRPGPCGRPGDGTTAPTA